MTRHCDCHFVIPSLQRWFLLRSKIVGKIQLLPRFILFKRQTTHMKTWSDQNKIGRHEESVLFNQTCLNEKMLPIYICIYMQFLIFMNNARSISVRAYIYIYIYSVDKESSALGNCQFLAYRIIGPSASHITFGCPLIAVTKRHWVYAYATFTQGWAYTTPPIYIYIYIYIYISFLL